MTATVLTSVDNGVALVTFNRPGEMNALDASAARGLVEALERLAADETLRVLVLAGNGPAFSAGGDFNWVLSWPDLDAIERRAAADALMGAIQALHDFPLPTVARVHGATVGGGIGVMLACDYIVASRSARFGLTSARNGLLAGIAIPGLVEAVGARVARQLLMHGGVFDAETAQRLGLVDQLAVPAELDAAVADLVRELKLAAPGVQTLAKALVGEVAAAPDSASANELVGVHVANQCISDEAREGMSAFLAKRTPPWV